MLMLSITPMDIAHIDEICKDLQLQQEQGITSRFRWVGRTDGFLPGTGRL